MKTIQVVAAAIKFNDQYLCVQRGASKKVYIDKKFEFPGGKIEDGENPEDALIREIREELDMEIHLESHLITVDHTYPDFRIIMQTFVCTTERPEYNLNEHLNGFWLQPESMDILDWAAADLPIVDALKKLSQ
jgi:8-oxo-dGTP diphosphatase